MRRVKRHHGLYYVTLVAMQSDGTTRETGAAQQSKAECERSVRYHAGKRLLMGSLILVEWQDGAERSLVARYGLTEQGWVTESGQDTPGMPRAVPRQGGLF